MTAMRTVRGDTWTARTAWAEGDVLHVDRPLDDVDAVPVWVIDRADGDGRAVTVVVEDHRLDDVAVQALALLDVAG